MITPIWGTPYIDRWLGFGFASQRSSGNIPHLTEHCDFELAIITKSADAAYMQANSRFNDIMSGIRVRFILMDEFFPRTRLTSYGVPLTLAYAKAILELGEKAIGTFVILMNADAVLASGSLKGIVERIRDGYTIIAAGAIRVIDRAAQPQLLEFLDKDSGILSVSPRDMMRLANEYLHSTVTGRIVNEPSPIIDSTYYHQIYWRISEDCLALRGFLLHPLCFQIERLIDKVLCPVDYGFLTEFCPNGRFCVLDDSDKFLMLELQERDSESHWLRIAPKDSTCKRLGRLTREIVAQAATWTTGQHRRSATWTIYWHEKDLPSDIARRVAPFEKFVDGILAKMPPPVSHIGHFQWLPAVRQYKEDLIGGGSEGTVAPLDDPRNNVTR
jgi:hypothetical protein